MKKPIKLTAEKSAAIINGYNTLTLSERELKNGFGESSHSRQWYLLNSLRISAIDAIY